MVDPELHDRPAGIASRWARHALGLERPGQRHVRLGQDHAPERALVEQLLDAAGGPEPAERVADHQRHAGVRARAPHPLARLDGVRDRLLHEHVATALGARERLLLVHVVRRHEQHALDIRMLDRVLEARRRLAAEALGELAAPRPRRC